MSSIMRKSILYSSNFGVYNIIQVWLNRIIWTVVLLMALSKFDQNPNGLTILIIIISIILLRIKSEQIIISNMAIVIKRKLFFDLLPITTTIEKVQIQEIKLQGNRNLGNNLFQNILPIGIKFRNTISIHLKNGRTKTFKTSIFTEELEKFKDKYSNFPDDNC